MIHHHHRLGAVFITNKILVMVLGGVSPTVE